MARYDAVAIACESNRGPGKLSRQTLDGGPSIRCLTACSDTEKQARDFLKINSSAHLVCGPALSPTSNPL